MSNLTKEQQLDNLKKERELNERLDNITKLKDELDLLSELKKEKIDKRNNLQHDVKDYLNDNNLNCIEMDKKDISVKTFEGRKINKKYNRKVTLTTTYEAIESILGQDAVEIIKNEIKNKKDNLKKNRSIRTVSIIPIGYGRKDRKDKGIPRSTKTNQDNKKNGKGLPIYSRNSAKFMGTPGGKKIYKYKYMKDEDAIVSENIINEELGQKN